jgi:hypothetical protein
MSMKKSSDTIGNRTHDLPACSAVPQPTAPPGAPNFSISRGIILDSNPGSRLDSLRVLLLCKTASLE